MIAEDYCSFELCKLLKEKGFDEYCLKNYWSTDKELHNWRWELSYNRNSDGNRNTKDCAAPTYEMALKWLRDTHRLVVNIAYIDFLEHGEVWSYEIIQRDTFEIKHKKCENLHTYEDAAEAAIKYCLTNLI